MRRLGLITLIFCLNGVMGFAKESIRYKLSMPEPHTHYFEVEMVLEGFKENQINVKMPVWAPGSYLIREFSKNVDAFGVFSPAGDKVDFEKVNKNTWRIQKANLEKVIVKYTVYAFEMSVRTSFLDADHGFVSGSGVFMYVEENEDLPHELRIVPHENWEKVSTSLPAVSGAKFTYRAKDYDQLADCPIEIGNHREIAFEAAGITHRIAMYGEGNYEENKLKKDLKKVIEGLTEMFGENPNDDYLFIIHNLEKSSGGLEHMNSTTLQVNRWTYSPEANYNSFLTLAAHEYIHLWLVKRLRPAALGPFDYDQENYTRLLWVMEGFTSYFSQLILCQLGYMNQNQYLGKLEDSFTSMENAPGNRVQPVSMASFDAWIKAYRPDENSGNSQISYYHKGSVVAALLDVLIIHNSKGKHDLATVLRDLYDNFYKKSGKGITDQDMKTALEKYAATSLDGFYARYINGTEEIDYDKYLSLAGLNVSKTPFFEDDAKRLGVSLSDNNGKISVRSVQAGTPAYKYGINANDEILAVEGYRVTGSKGINTVLENRKIGDKIEVLVARDGKIRSIPVTLEEIEGYYYRIRKDKSAGTKKDEVLRNWLTL